MKPGDKYWFPPHPTGAEEGLIMTVMRVENVHPYGEMIFWTDGTHTKVSGMNGAYLIDEAFIRRLWVRSQPKYTCDRMIRPNEGFRIDGPNGMYCTVPIQGDEKLALERVDLLLEKMNGA